MSEPEPKRLRLDPSIAVRVHFDQLPPDAVVSDILPYLHPSDMIGPVPRDRKKRRFFGRFTRDGLRYAWFVFRDVEITIFDIFRGVIASTQAHHDASENIIKKKISDALPYVNHKQVMRYTMTMNRTGPSSRNLERDYSAEYTRARIKVERLNESNPKKYPDRWPELSYQNFIPHFRRVMTLLLQPRWNLLRSLGGSVFELLSLFKLSPRFVFKKTIPADLAIDFSQSDVCLWRLPEIPCNYVTKISGFGCVDFGNLSNTASFTRLFKTFPKVVSLDLTGFFSNRTNTVLVSDLAPIFRDGRTFTYLRMGEVKLRGKMVYPWFKQVTGSLSITRESSGELPELSPSLKFVGLSYYIIPEDFHAPRTVHFWGCAFTKPVTVLHGERVRNAIFRSSCWWPSRNITIMSMTLTTLHWTIRTTIRAPDSLVLSMPKLKRFHLSYQNRFYTTRNQRTMVSVTSNATLDLLHIVSYGGWEVDITLNNGAKILDLVGDFPNFGNTLSRVEKIFLRDTPAPSVLSQRTGYDFLPNQLQLVHVIRPKDSKQAYKDVFRTENVTFKTQTTTS